MRNIVIDIDDPNDVGRDALAAMRNAVRPGDRIHFFHHMFHQSLGQSSRSDQMLGEARGLLHGARKAQLESLASLFVGYPYTITVTWTEHGWQSLLQHASTVDAQLVVAKSNRSPRWRSLGGVTDDWQLIRHSKVPLLLWRPECAHRYKRILAAIDPLHVDDKPAELDRRILAQAAELAVHHDARLCVLNVVADSAMPAASLNLPPVSLTAPRRSLAAHQARVATLIEELDINVDEVIVVPGIPARDIVRTTTEQTTDLVVMGAVARSTLRNLLIGNTAERVLDQLCADTLIIKPADLVTRHSGRANRRQQSAHRAAQSTLPRTTDN